MGYFRIRGPKGGIEFASFPAVVAAIDPCSIDLKQRRGGRMTSGHGARESGLKNHQFEPTHEAVRLLTLQHGHHPVGDIDIASDICLR